MKQNTFGTSKKKDLKFDGVYVCFVHSENEWGQVYSQIHTYNKREEVIENL